MSIRLLSAAWDLVIPSTEKMVLMCLCDHANDDGVCWPSIETLCRKTSKGERTVQSALKWLAENDFFTFKDGEHKARTYYLDPRKICTPAKSAPRKSRTPQNLQDTPAKSAPHPRKSRTQTTIEPSRTVNNTITAHALPDDWRPTQFGLKTKSREIVDGWPPGEVDAQFEHFAAHHRAKGSKFKDWQDAWSTWVLNSRKFGDHHGNGRRRGNQRAPEIDGFQSALRRMQGIRDEAPSAENRPGSPYFEGMG